MISGLACGGHGSLYKYACGRQVCDGVGNAHICITQKAILACTAQPQIQFCNPVSNIELFLCMFVCQADRQTDKEYVRETENGNEQKEIRSRVGCRGSELLSKLG